MNGVRVGSSKDLVTVTDELRRMLDERGVEWWPMHDVENGYHQDRDTEFVIDGKKYTAHEWGGTLNVYGFTPEQAVEATLGRGTCRNVAEPDEYSDRPFTCSECGARGPMGNGTYHIASSWAMEDGTHVFADSWPVWKYCPNCGRKVVGE